MPKRLRAILAGGVVAALVVLSVTGWLMARALHGVHEEEVGLHEALAEDLFDEIEGELSDLVAREEQRSFLEYRHLYVPEGTAGSAGLVRSPLASLPDDPSILGYFQLDAGGSCTNPAVPRGNELNAAVDAGFAPSDRLDAMQDEVSSVLGRIATWDVVPPPIQAEQGDTVEQQPANDDAQQMAQSTVQLKRGARNRSERKTQQLTTKGINLEAFNKSDIDVLDNMWNANAAYRTPAGLTDQGYDTDVDVSISPIAGLRVDEHLVLHRQVRVGPEVHRQGLILRLDALAERLEGRVLAGSELQPWVTLAWDGDVAPDRPHTFEHAFAPPFQSLHVAAALHRVPVAYTGEGRVLWALAVLVLGIVVVGGVGLWRAIRAEVELAQRRTDFAAAVTHELKTPLTTIRMYGEMLRDGMVPAGERQHAYHGTIVEESERLARLVSNVLELARLEQGAPAPPSGPIDARAMVREVASRIESQVERSGATLTVTAPDDLPPIQADRDGLEQVLVNLVDNAVKFGAQSGDRRVHIDARSEGDSVEMRVRDHGPGVPKSQLKRIFEPYYRGERELTRRTQGTGIGLALVVGLIGRAGGTVEARNHPEGGLEVVLRLPALDQAR